VTITRVPLFLSLLLSSSLLFAEGAAGAGKPEKQALSLRVPEGFRAAAGTGPEPYSGTGWAKEVIHLKTGIEMVFIPAGEFPMGSPPTEKGRDADEGPLHPVRITKPFYLGKYEVTQGQWNALMESNPSLFGGSERLPVEALLWDECQAFLKKAGGGLRLPTEAEWEYACRAGSTARFCFGDDEAELADYAWYEANSRGRTHEVGRRKPNAWGLYDMHGNVWEWCKDWYDARYYAKAPSDDPPGPSWGTHHILRGGGWFDPARFCRSANRNITDPTDVWTSSGFRVARSLE